MVTRHAFDESLENLHIDLEKMAAAVEKSIDDAVAALKGRDIELAEKTIVNDDVIDDMEREIESKCIKLIAMQQPIAKDLRLITSILKMLTDLERIADHSSDICELMLEIKEKEYIKPLIDIPKAAYVARQMVREAINAYIRKDIELARSVCEKDTIVDELYDTIVNDLKEFIIRDSKNIDQAITFIQIAKYIERMSDHATNLAEWVIYIITGDHKSLN